MPVNFLLYLSLLRLSAYYGDSFKVECPTGSGKHFRPMSNVNFANS